MKRNWQIKKIGDVIFHDVESAVDVESDKIYKMVGVYSYGRGLFDKEELAGINTSYKVFYKLKPNHIVLSQLFGWEGAIALSSHEFSGKHVSSQFPTFLVNEKFADKKFVAYYLQQGIVWKKLFEVGVGMGSRRRTLNPSNLLNLPIPLPPLPEQHRIVSKIESVKNKLEQIKELRATQTKDINNLLFSKYSELVADAEWLPMSEVAPIHRRQVEIKPDTKYFEIGVRSFGRGLFEKPDFQGSDLTWQKPFWMKEGDLLFSNIKAWEGAVGLIPKQYDGWVGSHRYITCLPNLEIINPEFLYYYFRIQEGVAKLNLASPGTADRNRTLNTKMLSQMLVPVPDMGLQKEFVELLHKVNVIKGHHTQTEKELNELLPGLLDKAFKGEI
jgi:type I restriction enzyme S subunit